MIFQMLIESLSNKKVRTKIIRTFLLYILKFYRR